MIHFAGAEEGSPREKYWDRLVFVHLGECCSNRLCEYIFRFGIWIMEMIVIMHSVVSGVISVGGTEQDRRSS